MFRETFLSLFLAFFISTVAAAPRTVTLDVPSMNCSTCPLTVKLALKKVEGVSEVTVDFDTREAVITFDDSKTTVQALTEATANAGYPSSLKKGNSVDEAS